MAEFYGLPEEVLDLLSQADRTFADIATDIEKLAAADGDVFNLACRFITILEHSPTSTTKMNASYFLYHAYASYPLIINPFLSHFVSVWRAHQEYLCERGNPGGMMAGHVAVVGRILGGRGQDVVPSAFRVLCQGLDAHMVLQLKTRTAKEVLGDLNDYAPPGRIEESVLGALREQGVEEPAPFVYIHGHGNGKDKAVEIEQTVGEMKEVVEGDDGPDTDPTTVGSDDEVYEELLTKASEESLSKADTATLLDHCHLAAGHASVLFPDTVQGLLQHNPQIALRVLTILLQTDQRQDTISAIARLPTSLPTLETLNALFASDPALLYIDNLLHNFLSHTARHLESLNKGEERARRVRLVCLFVMTLVRGEVIELKEYWLDFWGVLRGNLWVDEAAVVFGEVGMFREEEGMGG